MKYYHRFFFQLDLTAYAERSVSKKKFLVSARFPLKSEAFESSIYNSKQQNNFTCDNKSESDEQSKVLVENFFRKSNFLLFNSGFL